MKPSLLRRLYALLAGSSYKSDFVKYCLGVTFTYSATISTFNQARNAFSQSGRDSEKWFVHLRSMIAFAKTFDQALDALDECYAGTKEAEDALEKALSLMTHQDLARVSQYVGKKAGDGLLPWGHYQRWMDQWNRISLQQLKEAAPRPDDCIHVYDMAPAFSPARQEALRKYCSLARVDDIAVLLKSDRLDSANAPVELAIIFEHLANTKARIPLAIFY